MTNPWSTPISAWCPATRPLLPGLVGLQPLRPHPHPRQPGQGTRWAALPDPSCSPYLELAVCLAAGLDGIEKEHDPRRRSPRTSSPWTRRPGGPRGIESLPGSLEGHPRPGGRPVDSGHPGRACGRQLPGRARGGSGTNTAPASPPGSGRSTSSTIKGPWRQWSSPLRARKRPETQRLLEGLRDGRLPALPLRGPGQAPGPGSAHHRGVRL